MCGIAGFWDAHSQRSHAELEQIAQSMATALQHRGPDDAGVWVDESVGVGLAHRRLAILDLSADGHQPIMSADHRYLLVYNGEIYNHSPLRQELAARGHCFRGRSDTAVVLAAFCEWGVQASLSRFVGMFAMAVWDRQNHSLYLLRDRAGEKPLYYGWSGGVLLFGSELKALRRHPDWNLPIDRNAVSLFTRYGYVPAPHSIYQQIRKLPPASFLKITPAAIQSAQVPTPVSYWSLPSVVLQGADNPFPGTEEDAMAQLQALLLMTIGQQTVADVPLGAFLSGGIDSSLVVSLMQAQSSRRVKTFSIGFTQDILDEAPFARAVSRHLGTDHTELYLQPEDVRQAISRLTTVYDEPFADSSEIPTVLLCQLARAKVTVSLSGDAGDELFGGYRHYRKLQRIWPLIRQVPRRLRQPLARTLRATALHFRWPAVEACRFWQRLENFAGATSCPTAQSLYQRLMSPNRDPAEWLKYKESPESCYTDKQLWENVPGLLPWMMCTDFLAYLPDDLLVKVDRAAMAVGLETRIPFLDHRLVEFAWTLPNSFKQRRGKGKYLLRQLLFRYVPRHLVERPKQGFGVPIAAWLRGPLRTWARELLAVSGLGEFFDPKVTLDRWDQHQAGTRDYGAALWHILMFQAWLSEQKNRTSAPAPHHTGAAHLVRL